MLCTELSRAIIVRDHRTAHKIIVIDITVHHDHRNPRLFCLLKRRCDLLPVHRIDKNSRDIQIHKFPDLIDLLLNIKGRISGQQHIAICLKGIADLIINNLIEWIVHRHISSAELSSCPVKCDHLSRTHEKPDSHDQQNHTDHAHEHAPSAPFHRSLLPPVSDESVSILYVIHFYPHFTMSSRIRQFSIFISYYLSLLS